MTLSLRELAGALGAGTLCGAGLVLSGMTQPAKVIGFLDVFGNWDPSLVFVMVGAISVHIITRAWARRFAGGRVAHPSLAPAAKWHGVTLPLVVGSAVFGVGWGLAGYCPGPAIVALGTGTPKVIAFMASVVFGAWLVPRVKMGRLTPAARSALTEP